MNSTINDLRNELNNEKDKNLIIQKEHQINIEKLNLLKNSIEQNNFSELKSLIERANKIKRVLK